ncbi:hypothetical protein K435DRAFT_776938 [Dendrothele bispora CBS 962.96]|uniref:DUF6699 domain-containing protein n=1 Tax=Dendrothele bispora (strain CBS 962.96) TaxID=1314807 RepID=A0A4S8MB87_DENBC|nr:hypothetical protein K435DRAFT_776938 [Dendrothele bispora CBS 962.96]
MIQKVYSHHSSSTGSSSSRKTLDTRPRSRTLSLPPPLMIPEAATRLHYLLAYIPYHHPAVYYDLSLHPSTVERYHAPNILSESATDPPMPSLIVTCPFLNWELFITPSMDSRRTYVSVSDVFHSLYSGLRKAVHPVEYEGIPSLDVKNLVDQAYFNRCKLIGDYYAQVEEHKKGVKRVDFLMGRSRFLGLSSRRGDSRIWELNVS